MIHLQHNLLNLFYVIKSLAETHLSHAAEGWFLNHEERLRHAEEILQRACLKAKQGLEITRRIQRVVASSRSPAQGSSTVSLNETWREVSGILCHEFPEAGVETIQRIPDPFPEICCDPADLQEILYHLSKNALQALRGQGKLILRAELGFSSKEHPYAIVTVADTGPGIPAERLERLFQPFFTTKDPGEGGGLGLYLTQKLVERNRGRIAVSSYSGCGTTIALEFSTQGQHPL